MKELKENRWVFYEEWLSKGGDNLLQMDKIISGDREYCIKRLDITSEIEVQDLCERCTDFSMLIEGRSPDKQAGYELLTDLPPDKNLNDKYVLGVYNDKQRLIAVVDLLRDYKVTGEWTIGLLMIDPQERGHGLGRELHEFVKKWVAGFRAHSLRIGVVEENAKALAFWSRQGYRHVERVEVKYGNKQHVVIVMKYCVD